MSSQNGELEQMDQEYGANINSNQVQKPGMDSPEFLAYFEKFMMENSSFYVSTLNDMNNRNNHSDNEGIDDYSDDYSEYDSN